MNNNNNKAPNDNEARSKSHACKQCGYAPRVSEVNVPACKWCAEPNPNYKG